MQAILHYCVLIGTEGSTQFLHARNFCMHTMGSCSMLFPCASHGRKKFLRAPCRHTQICALEAVNLQHGQARSAPSSHKFMRTHRRHTHICALEAANPQHEQARTNPSNHTFMRAHCRHTHCHTTRIATLSVSRKAGSYGNCCACIGFIDKLFFQPFNHMQELCVFLRAHSILQHLLVRSTV